MFSEKLITCNVHKEHSKYDKMQTKNKTDKKNKTEVGQNGKRFSSLSKNISFFSDTHITVQGLIHQVS